MKHVLGPPSVHEFLREVESSRQEATGKLDPRTRGAKGQFFTPAPIAMFMASLFDLEQDTVYLLDAGAGVGSLTAALAATLCTRERHPSQVVAAAFENDPVLTPYVTQTLERCRAQCEEAGIRFVAQHPALDFIDFAVNTLSKPLLMRAGRFDAAILNPPYRKINSDSDVRHSLRLVGIETSNLYAAFLALAIGLLKPGGELVAITPRSFCNGPYFKPFRALLLDEMDVDRLHVYETRDQAFGDDAVLQENVIVHARKVPSRSSKVTVSVAAGPDDPLPSVHRISREEVIRPDDPDRFIHFVSDELSRQVSAHMAHFTTSLEALGVTVSTGRVVDFRALDFLCTTPGELAVPLIYPAHFERGGIVWPRVMAKKANYIIALPKSADVLVPNETYVLVKRFSAKEEPRRVVASVYDHNKFSQYNAVGFENHLNYYHQDGRGLLPVVARGLSVYLNSTLLDEFFRLFSGHTQVNAADLRMLRYPTTTELEDLGNAVGEEYPTEDRIDEIIAGLFGEQGADPIRAKKKITDAVTILRSLGVPRGMQTERSALTLLALTRVTPGLAWSDAQAPEVAVPAMMSFFAEYYGKQYAPNTREELRRYTLQNFLDAGLISAVSSGLKATYQIAPHVLPVIQAFRTTAWETQLASHPVQNNK